MRGRIKVRNRKEALLLKEKILNRIEAKYRTSWQKFYYYAEISGMNKLLKMGYDPGEILEDLADIHMVEVIFKESCRRKYTRRN
ncbi:hypothetical protein [Thermococcus chitonophagus]|nr:hypothetical protein [Thermococcus chitonophagus]CUX76860.1 hypothetical protein CHITON_0081 [Thermococcus chitonophagus]